MRLFFLCFLLCFGISRLSAAVTSTDPVIISSLAGDFTDLGGNSLAQVATNPSGNAVAVWQNIALAGLDGIVKSIEAAVFTTVAGSWSTNVTIGNGIDPQVAIADNGNAIAVWVNGPRDDLSWTVQASHYDATTATWSDVVDIPNPNILGNKGVYTPQIAMTPTGNAITVWSDGFNNQIYGSTFVTGGTTIVWSDASQISVTSGVLPQISMRRGTMTVSTGVATVVWQTTIQESAKIEIQTSFVSIS